MHLVGLLFPKRILLKIPFQLIKSNNEIFYSQKLERLYIFSFYTIVAIIR